MGFNAYTWQSQNSSQFDIFEIPSFVFVRLNIAIALTRLRLTLELAGDFGKEFEGETSARLPVTYAAFAVARLTALHSVGSKGAVCKGSKHFYFENSLKKGSRERER